MSRRTVTVEDVYKPGREPGGYQRWREAHSDLAAEHDSRAQACAHPGCFVLLDPAKVTRYRQRYCSLRCRRSHARLLVRAAHPPRHLTPEELHARREVAWAKASVTMRAQRKGETR